MQLGPKLVAKQTLKQTLTPSLVQMVNILAMNKLELQEAISQELLENPLLDETQEEAPPTMEELLEAEAGLRREEPADSQVLAAAGQEAEAPEGGSEAPADYFGPEESPADGGVEVASMAAAAAEMAPAPADAAAEAVPAESVDPFEQIDFGSFFDDYLDPGYRSRESEEIERPSFENFLSAPTTLTDHLRWQLSVAPGLSDEMRAAAEAVIGNLDEDGYLTAADDRGRRALRVEEIAESEQLPEQVVREALSLVQTFDPAGVGARDLRECLLLQLFQRPTVQILAITLVSEHLTELQNPQKDLSRLLHCSLEELQTALAEVRKLDPYPGRRFNPNNARLIEPDVALVKGRQDRCPICGQEGCPNEYQVVLNDEGLPQLSLNHQYRSMRWERGERDVARYIRERYASAIQFLKNLEQRRQTIARVCHSIVARQADFLNYGLDFLKPMMIKDVAEEIGVHPSTVSRAVANKYAHTPQGVLELRFFFTESVQGVRGGETSLLILKRRVKRIIAAEDPHHPLTDDQLTRILHQQGIDVTRRTVAKYREDMNIPSTHRRRVKK